MQVYSRAVPLKAQPAADPAVQVHNAALAESLAALQLVSFDALVVQSLIKPQNSAVETQLLVLAVASQSVLVIVLHLLAQEPPVDV